MSVNQPSVYMVHPVMFPITGYFNSVEKQGTYSQHQFDRPKSLRKDRPTAFGFPEDISHQYFSIGDTILAFF